MVEVAHALVHWAPHHLPASLPLLAPANLEFARIVDHRLDAEDLPELVVHLQPVVLDAMLDPGPWPAILLAIGQHLAVETRVQTTPQESQNVRGREMDAGMVEKTRVEPSQALAIGEQHIGAIL